MNIFNAFEDKLKQLLSTSDIKEKDGGALDLSRVTVESPRDPAHGDLATNAAMVLSKSVGPNPRQLAERIIALFSNDTDIKDISIAGPGFINLRLTDDFWRNVLKNILENDKNYGKSLIGKGRKVNVEYVSANPTGPLHVGHCRGAVIGDVLANLLQFTGYDVTKEYYLNDAGGQIDTLANSVLLRYKQALGENIGEIPTGLYPGEYLIPVGEKLKEEYADRLIHMDKSEAINIIKDKTIQEMVRIIRDDLSVLNIHHDLFFSERSLHANNAESIRSTINDLATNGYIYKGTLPPPKGELPDDWEDREQTLFRSTIVGDDQDRPLIKSNGAYTYFAADVAYFKDKFDRGFNEMIYVLGADHGGYVKRLEAVAKAISNGTATLSVLLCQLVKLSKNGQPITMSKRAGNFITLRDVVDEVGPDPVRFMMLYRKSDAPLDFDFAKVTERSKENPVFYVQYASARCHSIFREAVEKFDDNIIDVPHFIDKVENISNEDDVILIRKLAEFPRLVEQATLHREPHRLAFYLYDLASSFHAHWNKGLENKALRFIQVDDRNITQARLGLVKAVSTVLTIGLTIIGADAPTEMR